MINLGLKLTSMQFLQPFPNNFLSLRNSNLILEVFSKGSAVHQILDNFLCNFGPGAFRYLPDVDRDHDVHTIDQINQSRYYFVPQSIRCLQSNPLMRDHLKSILSIIIRFLCNNFIQTSSCSVNQSILQWSRSADHWDRFKINQSIPLRNQSFLLLSDVLRAADQTILDVVEVRDVLVQQHFHVKRVEKLSERES